MKKAYNAPVSEIVMFDSADVITTSGRVNATDRPATDFNWTTDSNGNTYATSPRF